MTEPKSTLICDIETDGLNASVVHVIVGYDTLQGKFFVLDNQETMAKDAQALFNNYDRVVGHNFIQFDAPVLRNVLGVDLPHDKIWDTLVVSRMAHIDMKQHSLEAWGELLGYAKVEHEDWSVYTSEMLHRCKTDVELNYKLYNKLMKDVKSYSELSLRIEFYMAKMLKDQKEHGFPVDLKAMGKLYNELEQESARMEDRVLEEFVPLLKPICVKGQPTVRQAKRTKDGKLSKVGLKKFFTEEEAEDFFGYVSNLETEADQKMGGLWCPLKLEPFNVRSTPQVVERLNKVGWEPVEFTEKGNARLTQTNLDTLPEDSPDCFFTLQKLFNLNTQMSTLNTWYNAMDSEGRVHGTVHSPGTWTHRCTHSAPNTANIAQHLRFLWKPREGSVLLGADAAGIQLRVLAHLMGDDEYIRQIIEGDIHTFNQKMAGFDTRSQAKTFIYAWVLGAGYEKIGQIAEINDNATAKGILRDNRKIARQMLEKIKYTNQWREKNGKPVLDVEPIRIARMVKGYLLEKSFLTNLPELARLKEEMVEIGNKGYLECWDGRRIIIPPYKKREALAAHLQGFEATLMKLARGIWTKKCESAGLEGVQCLSDVHDEWQTNLPKNLITDHKIIEFDSGKSAEDWEREWDGRIWSMPRKLSTETYDKETGAGKYAVYYSQVGEFQVRAIRKAGKILGSKCPMDGDYVIGLNWAETH